MVKNPRTIILAGEISLSAAGAVLSHNLDFVTSVTKSATGEYTILLDDKYVQTKYLSVQHEGTSADRVKVKADTQATNSQIKINTLVANVVADVTTACNIHVLMVFKDSTVK